MDNFETDGQPGDGLPRSDVSLTKAEHNYPSEQQKLINVLEKRRRDILRPDWCYVCNGSGVVRKPIEEWDDGEHEYHACPRVTPPVKTCPACKGTGSTG